jgi:hypothetical protein
MGYEKWERRDEIPVALVWRLKEVVCWKYWLVVLYLNHLFWVAYQCQVSEEHGIIWNKHDKVEQHDDSLAEIIDHNHHHLQFIKYLGIDTSQMNTKKMTDSLVFMWPFKWKCKFNAWANLKITIKDFNNIMRILIIYS